MILPNVAHRSVVSFLTLLLSSAAVLLTGCNLVPVIPAARIRMREPLGTIYWGQTSNSLLAGVTIQRPVVDEKKLGSPPYMPSVVLLYKLRNVGDRPILLVSPFYADGMSNGELRFAHSGIFKRLPEPREMPGPSFVVELLPGGELSEEFDYRIPERPHRMVVRFDYHNYARQVVVRGDGEPAIVGDLWTGHVESAVLEARID